MLRDTNACGKLEQPDLLEIICIGLGSIQFGEKLWPFSGATAFAFLEDSDATAPAQPI